MSGRGRAARRSGGGGFSAVWTSLSLLFMLALVGIAAGLFVMTEVTRSGPTQQETVFVVAEGAGAIAVANQLDEQGLIRSPLAFRAAAIMFANDRPLQAGEYAIPAGASPRAIFEMFASGEALQYEITIPEGWTSAMAMERIAAADFLTGEMPETPPEGAIMPDTYHVPRGMERAAVVAQMREARDSFLAEAWAGRGANIPVTTPDEAVILASIVEKETGIASERDEVAGVFTNRLRRGMRLESDPTIIYGVCRQFPNRCRSGRLINERTGEPRGIRRSELEMDTGYNTYRIDRLPPTPIANPGRDALAAVLNPPATDNLFFVALEPGNPAAGHIFSRTYEEHNAAVQRYRAAEAAAAAAEE
jgi:UPF0755 protein